MSLTLNMIVKTIVILSSGFHDGCYHYVIMVEHDNKDKCNIRFLFSYYGC